MTVAARNDRRLAIDQVRRSSSAFSHSLLRAGGHRPEGFEEDPITYLRFGWKGGPLPPHMQAELGRGIAGVLRDDFARMWRDAARKREERNIEAVDHWMKKKELEARLRAEVSAEHLAEELHRRQCHSIEERDAHYEAWCKQYDA
eukprot:CAMPEP_0172886108 /NCGR_PEP_ID=MMETSP1075-20121228/130046_1 /TAXON_ID=2916 /ORGANISM="Ceratium fusus, Strain PA161109" /LENGTH=144 /DNA_ID=CAMNT_0013739533 /DNA_START=167 /DNA_END=598 /DNA_ORIENTATION=-